MSTKNAKEQVLQEVADNAILVLSKSYCPYCTKTKSLLNKLVPKDKMDQVKIIELDRERAELQAGGTAIHNQRTVPQIWIGGEFIGGNSDFEGRYSKDPESLKTMIAKSFKSAKTAEDQVRELIKAYPVLVLAKSHCPHCAKTRPLLRELVPEKDHSKLMIIEVDEERPELQAGGTAIHGQKTVPQIWIGGQFIGGNSDLQKLNTEEPEKLRTMIKNALSNL